MRFPYLCRIAIVALIYALSLACLSDCAKAATYTVTFGTPHASPVDNEHVNSPITVTVSASVNGTNNQGQECIIQNQSWQFYIISVLTCVNGSWSTASSSSYSISYSAAQQASNPSTFTVTFSQAGYYLINYGATVTFNSPNGGGNGLTASGSDQTGLFVVDSADFSYSVAPSTVTINYEDSATVTPSASPIDGFVGIVSESMSGFATGITGSFIGDGTLDLLPGQSDSTTVTLSVSPQATPGQSTVLFVGTGGSPSHQKGAVVTITVPKRYIEIDGSVGPPGAANYSKGTGGTQVPNTRSSTGSLTVDTMETATIVRGNTVITSVQSLNAASATGFKSSVEYNWSATGGQTLWYDPSATWNAFSGSQSSMYAGLSPTTASDQSQTFTLQARNSGGSMVTSNTYTVRSHPEFENYTMTVVAPDDTIDATQYIQDNEPTADRGVSLTLNPKPIELQGYWFEETATVGVASLASIGDPWLGAFLAAAGANGVYFQQPTGQTYSDSESSFVNSIAETEAGAPNLFSQSSFLQQAEAAYASGDTTQLNYLWGQCMDFSAISGGTKGYWQPKEMPLYHHHLYTGDGYGTQGYLGTRYARYDGMASCPVLNAYCQGVNPH